MAAGDVYSGAIREMGRGECGWYVPARVVVCLVDRLEGENSGLGEGLKKENSPDRYRLQACIPVKIGS